mmetsp:Transcript_27320/g.84975  ORF Transcript_27320/g.84975 Transcript_27320/m.84975 type:complete len:250 (-) Transcript_27320:195-944(-)
MVACFSIFHGVCETWSQPSRSVHAPAAVTPATPGHERRRAPPALVKSTPTSQGLQTSPDGPGARGVAPVHVVCGAPPGTVEKFVTRATPSHVSSRGSPSAVQVLWQIFLVIQRLLEQWVHMCAAAYTVQGRVAFDRVQRSGRGGVSEQRSRRAVVFNRTSQSSTSRRLESTSRRNRSAAAAKSARSGSSNGCGRTLSKAVVSRAMPPCGSNASFGKTTPPYVAWNKQTVRAHSLWRPTNSSSDSTSATA